MANVINEVLVNQQGEINTLLTGDIISKRYVILRLLGAGGMGSVYLARDTVLNDTELALKVLHPEISKDKSKSKRFLREVELMRKINNPNVARTYDVGINKGMLYYTMEYLEGKSLEECLKEKPFSLDDLSEIIVQVCNGLESIHELEIVHRDLKPANIIILEDNKVKITDFGVARNKDSNLTRDDEIIGSVNYISPEIWQSKEISHSSDLYSLGIIIFEALIGKPPFHDDEPAAMMWYHIKQSPTPPKSIIESVPNWLNQLTLKLLSKKAEDRPASAREVAAIINRNRDITSTLSTTRTSLLASEAKMTNSMTSSMTRPSGNKKRTKKKSVFGSFWIFSTSICSIVMVVMGVYVYNFLFRFLEL